MNFFSNIRDRIKEKTAEMLEKKEFLIMVEGESKPIRRKAYLEEKKRNAWAEGKAIAKKEMEKTMQKNSPQKRTEQDFGIMKGLEDPYKYLPKQTNQKPNLNPPKTNLTKKNKRKK